MGIFLDCLKPARVTPILKKHGLDEQNMAKYRPISNLNFIGKILEKIVFEQLNDHLSNESTFYCHQSAYKTHHSTETALTKLTSDICTAMDKKNITISINYFNISSTALS